MVVVLALVSLIGTATPTWAKVNVADELHSTYDACIAKFTAAGKRDLVDQLDRSRHVFKIRKSVGTDSNPSDSTDAGNGVGTGGTTKWNPNDHGAIQGETGVNLDPCATLYHEMSHLADYDTGTKRSDTCQYKVGDRERDSGIAVGEVKATRKENEYRATQPDLREQLRTTYGGKDLPPPGVECLPNPAPPPSRGCAAGCGIGYGEPHLKTFDGLGYDLQAVGEFVLTRAAVGDLEVQGRQSAVPGTRTVTQYSGVAANVAGDRVGLYRRPDGMTLRVGGAVVELSTGVRALPRGGEIEAFGPTQVEVRWPDGSVLEVEAIGTASLIVAAHLSEVRKGTVEGLFGDFDGRSDNDLRVRGGAAIGEEPPFDTLYRTFADSWRVAQEGTLFDYGPGESTATFTDRTFPHKPVSAADLPNRSTAEAICRRSGATDSKVLAACTLDVGLTGEMAFAASAVAVQRRLVAGDLPTLTVTQPGGRDELTFAGTPGQKVFVDVPLTDLPDLCVVLHLFDPDGQRLAHGCIVNGSGFIDATVLPEAGRYTVALDPVGPETGRAAVRVITAVDQEGAISPNGPTVTATVNQPGAVSRFGFEGTAGQKVSVEVPTASLPDQCAVLELHDPGGEVIGRGCVVNGRGSIDSTVLPVSGRYAVVVNPGERATGTAELRLRLSG